MRVIPAVDLRDGACVQLVGGSFEREALRLPDAAAAAAQWREAGFAQLHVVDLDAAVSGDRSINATAVARILDESRGRVTTQVGGGIRDTDAMCETIARGADRVVVGTRALEDAAWLADVATRWPGRVVVAVDVADGRPVLRGWRAAAELSLDDALSITRAMPLAGLLITSVGVEGRMGGPDAALYERVIAATPLSLIASGGVGDVGHLRVLQEIGVDAVVVGMALYTGALDARATAEEFGA